MLQVQNLSQSIGRVQLLHGISCTAKDGTITALLGPNGAGKTTLLRSIMGLLPVPKAPSLRQGLGGQAGAENLISFDGNIINSWTVAQRVSAGLVYLPQHPSLLTDMSVKDNLQLVFSYHKYWETSLGDAAVQAKATFLQERDRWLALTGLSEHLEKQAGVLSGGQKRKLEVVRALLMHPKVMLLDEPFAGVDPKSIYELKELFVTLAQSGVGLLISDHHVDQLLAISSHIYVVIAGRVVTQGDVKDIMADEETKERYLGGAFYEEMAKKFL